MNAHGLAPVLLVDDRPENLTALEALLADSGVDLVKAHSGNEALRLSLKTEFALVLLDVQMPDMDGFETAELLRANPKTRRLPIIFVTAGMKDDTYRFKGYDSGAVDYLMKPIQPLELRSKVRVFSELFQQRKEIERHEQILETLVEQRTIALRENEVTYRSILENAADHVVRYDRRGAHLFANAKVLELTGFTMGQFLGKTHRDLGFPDHLCELWEGAIEKVFVTGQPTAVSFELDTGKGLVYLELKLSPEKDILGQVRSVVGLTRDLTERHRLDEARHFLAEASWTTNDEPFFEALARYLAISLAMDYVCIDRLEGDHKHAQTLAIYFDGQIEPNASYTLHDTPCGEVLKKHVCCFPEKVRQQFPTDVMLQDMVAESYVGTTLWSSRGEAIGLIALIGRQPLRNPALATQILELVAIRAGGELERKLADEALQVAEAGSRRLMDLLKASGAIAKIGGWEVDLVHNTLFWTPETYRIHDVTPETYTPTIPTALDFYTPEAKPIVTKAVEEALQTGKDFDLELQLLTASGRRIYVHTTGKVQRESGRAVRIVGAFRDITEDKRLEVERQQLEREIQHAQKLESLGSLAGGVAHDMNNVLAAILGMASALKVKYAADEGLGKALETILHASGRGRDLVKGLTDFARKGVEEAQALDLNSLVHKEVDLLRRTTLEKIEFELDLEASLPRVLGEPSSLGNTLMNVAMNALQAMPNGGRLQFQTRALDPQWVELTITDTGCGMSPEVMARATDPFFTTKPFGKGTGLGLAIVYGTMKAHGGAMELKSSLGQGTSVVLRFPARADQTDPALNSPTNPVKGRAALHILLVDDDELIRDGIPPMLEMLGHTVEVIAGGGQALARLQASGTAIDLVIMDHNMPGLTGAATLRQIRAEQPTLPLVLATGFVDADVSALLQDTPDIKILHKPYTAEEILRLINEIPLT
ncbi:MAG: response regulator [Holophaga sp.]|nr:response regulator [Holophaga sp.]